MKDNYSGIFMKKKAFVISGPSGTGKSTIIKMILDNFGDKITSVVSCTTRKKRDFEENGVDYYFITEKEFKDLVKENKFIEYVQCFGNFYGTAKFAVENALSKTDCCILDLEWGGAYNVLHKNALEMCETVGILILPPSIHELASRLKNRNSESEESLKLRLYESFNVKNVAKYEHVIINYDVEKSYEELLGIIFNTNMD